MVDVDKWTIETLVEACSANPTRIKLEIPKFQRRRAWKSSQEDELIDTMRANNFSIGALQLTKLPSENSIDRYLLADGLNRVSSLVKFFNNPFEFTYTKNLIEEIKIDFIKKYDKIADNTNLNHICDSWFSEKQLGSYNDFVIEKKFGENYEELKRLCQIGVEQEYEEVSKYLQEKTRELVKKINISKTVIPVIYNSCDRTTLPILFKRINQNNTPLSSCDILAAKWFDKQKLKVTNKKIITHIKAHYEKLKEDNNGMSIHSDPLDAKKNEYTVYEYIVGLRGYVLEKFPNTFLHLIKDKEFIFKLLSCCLSDEGDISKVGIENLKDIMIKLDLTVFEEKMLWSVGFVVECIGNIATVKKPNKNPQLIIREVPAIIQMIALSYKNRQAIEKKSEYYTKLYQLHILNDKLSELSFNTRTVKTMIEEKTYMSKVHRGAFVEKINNIILNQPKKNKSDLQTTQSTLLLNFMRMIVWNFDTPTVEVQNIIPRKIIAEYTKDKKCYLPINVFGNLAMVEPAQHRRKPTESLVGYLTRGMDDVDSEQIHKQYIYMDECIDYDDLIDELEISEKLYLGFLKKRGQQIRDIVSEHFKKYFSNFESESEDEESELDKESSEEESEEEEDTKPVKKINIKTPQKSGRIVLVGSSD